MKIGILTQPLATNYGGLLQAYALQKILSEKGHDVTIIQREKNSVYYKILRKIKALVCKNYTYMSSKTIHYVSQEIDKFINNNIVNRTKKINSTKALIREINKYNFDAYVVGSDQVWRPSYSPNIYNYYLDFIEEKAVKKIAYAASFGVEQWEYTVKETKRCAELAKSFDLISVREDSGINLCGNYLGVNAIHVLDPTMLLPKNDYIDIIRQEYKDWDDNLCFNENLFCYFLDSNVEKEALANKIANVYSLSLLFSMPKKYKGGNLNNENIYPSVSFWLSCFVKSSYVLTDSFHGCVFSIIFNKPFWVILNPNRGNSRFTSLLKLFGLENRIVKDFNITQWDSDISWNLVNDKLSILRKRSLDFIFRLL